MRLGDVAINSTVATRDHEADGYSRYIIGKHIPEDGGRVTSWNPVGDAEFGSRIRTMVRAGDVICTTRGPKLKVAVAEFDCLSAHTNFILRPKDSSAFLPGILEAVARSDGFQDHLRKHFRGSTNLFVNWSDAAQYEFALPSPEEQRRIARILAAATASVSTTLEAIARGVTARDALLVSLYTGGIRGGRPVSDSAVGRVPRGWRVDPLGERFQVQLGKMMSENARGGDGHIPYLRNANVQWNTLELDDVATMAFTEPERQKFSLRFGDILACEGRHVGKSAMWRDEIPGACYQKALHRLRAMRDDVPSYLLHCLRYYSITGRFGGATVETTIPHLPAEKLRAMHFPFPTRGEQAEIAEAIDAYDRSLGKLRVRHEHASGLLAKLLPSESV